MIPVFQKDYYSLYLIKTLRIILDQHINLENKNNDIKENIYNLQSAIDNAGGSLFALLYINESSSIYQAVESILLLINLLYYGNSKVNKNLSF